MCQEEIIWLGKKRHVCLIRKLHRKSAQRFRFANKGRDTSYEAWIEQTVAIKESVNLTLRLCRYDSLSELYSLRSVSADLKTTPNCSQSSGPILSAWAMRQNKVVFLEVLAKMLSALPLIAAFSLEHFPTCSCLFNGHRWPLPPHLPYQRAAHMEERGFCKDAKVLSRRNALMAFICRTVSPTLSTAMEWNTYYSSLPAWVISTAT